MNWVPPAVWGNSTLRDFVEPVLPDTVSLWPTTAAWLWPLGLALLLLTLGTIRLVQWWRRNRYRREALAALGGHETAQLPVLLKATALQAYGRPAVAALHGEAWLDFLNAQSPAAPFSPETAEALLAIDYLPPERWQTNPELTEAVRCWIRTHRLPTNDR